MYKIIKNILTQFLIVRYLIDKLYKGNDYNKYFRKYRYEKILDNLKTKDKITVIFMINDISQWKSAVLYKLFDKSKKYTPLVVVSSDGLYNTDIQKSMENIYGYFKENNYNIIKGYDEKNNKWKDLNKIYNPDIVFFSRAISNKESIYGIDYFQESLICYIPYSFFIDKNTYLQTGTLFHKKLWKYFVPTLMNKKMAEEEYDAKNIVVTNGYPGCDLFLENRKETLNPWTDDTKKKIIWAPHHTIEDRWDASYFSTFLVYYLKILELSLKYKDLIEICFKPHPGLKKKLYNHEDWGKEKTDIYYNKWNNQSNIFLSEGAYQELFIYSDAMILDSVSFLAEYLYLNKPYCFLTREDKGDYSEFLNAIGLKIFPVVYKAANDYELNDFLKNIVIDGNDSLILKRLNVIDKDLGIDMHMQASQKIFDIISSSILHRGFSDE